MSGLDPVAPCCSATEEGKSSLAIVTGHLSKHHGGHPTLRPLPAMANLSSYDPVLNLSQVRPHQLTKYEVGLFGAKVTLSQAVVLIK